MIGGTTEEEDEEEEDTTAMTQAMHMIGDTIMTENGQEVQILGGQSLGPGTRLITQAELERMMVSEGMVCASAGATQAMEMVSQGEGVDSPAENLPQLIMSADGQIQHFIHHSGGEEEEEMGKDDEEIKVEEVHEDRDIQRQMTETDGKHLDGDV